MDWPVLKIPGYYIFRERSGNSTNETITVDENARYGDYRYQNQRFGAQIFDPVVDRKLFIKTPILSTDLNFEHVKKLSLL